MQNFKKISLFILATLLMSFSFQSAFAQNFPSKNKNQKQKLFPVHDVKKKFNIKHSNYIFGKDLIIPTAELVRQGRTQGNLVPYKVNFQVKNIGTVDVTKRTRVIIEILRFSLEDGSSIVINGLLADRPGGNYDNFETNPILSGASHSYTAYVPNGLNRGYRYVMQVRVDACLGNGGECRVAEANEGNNSFQLAELILR